MAIHFREGNLFDSEAEALVNTVNCVGVMGKGVAYQFKRSYREMYKDYARRCKENKVKLGEVYSYREKGKVIINFPTKGHWKSRSKLEDIESGLKSLRNLLYEEGIHSVALPPLGCGNGGLDWNDVSSLIKNYLGDVASEVEVYLPYGQDFKSKVHGVPKLSLSHYICLELRSKLDTKSKVAFHKAAYFAEQVAGERGYFEFVPHKFGPWSKNIDHVMRVLTDYIESTGIDSKQYSSLVDRAEKVELNGLQAEKLKHWRSAIDIASSLSKCDAMNMEVAATIYEIVVDRPNIDEDHVIKDFFSWSDEKAPRFNEHDVVSCIRVLEDKGFLKKNLLGFQADLPERR